MELYHHGIKGQKWGVRNGPPYPLTDTAKYIGKKTKTGYEYVNRPDTKWTTERTNKDIAEINRLQEYDDAAIKDGKNLVYDFIYGASKVRQMTDSKDAENGLPKKRFNVSAEQDAKKVNPMYGDTSYSSGYNCALCTVGFDMRRRGYDVMARQHAPINFLYDISQEDLKWVYPDSKEVKTKNLDDAIKKIEKQPDNSRGALFAMWTGSDDEGHVVAYQVEDGKAVLYDAQSGEKFENPKDLFDDVYDVSYIRLDNVEPNYTIMNVFVE